MDLLENCVVRLLQTSDDTDSGSSLALRIITLIIVVLMIVGNGFFGRRSGKISNEFHL